MDKIIVGFSGGVTSAWVAGNGHMHAQCDTENCVRWME